jgi:MFS family permease
MTSAEPTTTGGTFRSLRTRNFRLFFVGQTISQIGNWLTTVALALLVYDLTDDGFAVGLLVACQFLPVLLIGAWAGLVADRSDKRRLLIIVQTLAMVQSFGLSALAFMDHPPLVAFYLVAAAGGFATAFDNPTRRSFVVEMVSQADMQNAVSLNSALMTGSRVVGPAVAGLLITVAGYGWCFLIDGISYVAVIYGLWLINPRELRSAPAAPRGKGQVREGLRYARSVPDLWVPLVMMAIVGTLAFNFQVVLPAFVTKALHSSTTMFTVLFAVFSVGSLAGALVSARRTTVSIRSVAYAAGAFGVSMAALALAPRLEVALAVGVVVGFASITFMIASTSIVQMRTEPSMRGRVLALQAMVFLGSTPIGGPIVGAITDTLGPRAGVLIGAAGCGAAALYGLRVVHHQRGALAAGDARTDLANA